MDLTASATGPGSGAACRPTPPVTLHSPAAERGPSESPPAWALLVPQLWVPWPRRRWPDSPIPHSPPWRERQAPAGAGLGACGARTAAGDIAQGRAGLAPGQPVSGTPTPPLSPQHRPKTAAAAAWGRGGMPPHSTRRPNPPCPAGARLGTRGTRTAAGPAPGPTNRRIQAPIRRLGLAGRVLAAPGEPVQPSTVRAGRPPSKGHVSPTFSTRSGHYPPTVY